MGKRHGHGELRCRDGTIYDVSGFTLTSSKVHAYRFLVNISSQGQWVCDHFNGLGTMSHCSGVTYEGIWINGVPERMASKLAIKSAVETIEIVQGDSFLIEVECQDDEGELVECKFYLPVHP